MNKFKMYLKIFLLLFIVFFMADCSKDDEMEQEDLRFKIILRNSRKTMTWVTNQNRDILFSGFPDEIPDTIFLNNVSDGDLIHLSLGYPSNGNGHFSINTYRNIPNGFDIIKTNTFSAKKCDNSFIQGEGSKIIRLEVTGINDYEEIFFPNLLLNSIVKTDTSVFVSSLLFDESDLIITILPKGEATYKSYFLKNNVWSNMLSGNQIYEQFIDFSEFSTSIVHELNIEKSGKYAFDIHILDKNEGITHLNFLDDTENFIKDDKIKFFITPEMEIENMKFVVKLKGTQHWYNSSEILTDFPSKFSFLDSDTDINLLDSGYIVNHSEKVNLLQNTFYYGDDLISNWNIFQKADAEANFELPPIPDIFHGSFDANTLKDIGKSTINICVLEDGQNQDYQIYWRMENDCISYYCKLVSTYY